MIRLIRTSQGEISLEHEATPHFYAAEPRNIRVGVKASEVYAPIQLTRTEAREMAKWLREVTGDA